jgi:hypothetical protein
MPFVKGQSGNPRGRAKSDFTIAALAKKHTPEVMKTLVHLMRHAEGEATRLGACRELLDRGWGKSPMVLAGTGGVGPAELLIRWEEEPKA